MYVIRLRLRLRFHATLALMGNCETGSFSCVYFIIVQVKSQIKRNLKIHTVYLYLKMS